MADFANYLVQGVEIPAILLASLMLVFFRTLFLGADFKLYDFVKNITGSDKKPAIFVMSLIVYVASMTILTVVLVQ